LAIITRRFMPPDRVMILLLRLSHSERSRRICSSLAGSGWLAEQAATETQGGQHRLEGIGVQFLRHQADCGACRAVVTRNVVPIAVTWPTLALTMPQMMLIRVVLPAPLGPSRARISPRRISRLMLRKASKPPA
jgi:hypothetical protein